MRISLYRLVMPVLVTGIHVFCCQWQKKNVDTRTLGRMADSLFDKSRHFGRHGHDEREKNAVVPVVVSDYITPYA